MRKALTVAFALLSPISAGAQTPAPATPPVATDVTAEQIRAFIAVSYTHLTLPTILLV